jgi:hypothetical protein
MNHCIFIIYVILGDPPEKINLPRKRRLILFSCNDKLEPKKDEKLNNHLTFL